MIVEAIIQRTGEKVASYIKKYFTLAGVEKKEEVLDLFDNILQIFPHWVIMTCPLMHQEIHYVSKNCSAVFGYSHDHLKNNSNLQKMFTYVHPTDQQDLYNCFMFMYNYLECIPPELHCEYRSIFHHRFKKQNGQYIYLHDEKAVLNVKGTGNLYYGLFRDVSPEKNFNGVKIEIFKQQPSLTKVAEYKPSAERALLTKREGELLTLFKQGLSTKEIAWHLNISHNTVRNIKSKLFEKFNVNNTIELLNMTA